MLLGEVLEKKQPGRDSEMRFFFLNGKDFEKQPPFLSEKMIRENKISGII